MKLALKVFGKSFLFLYILVPLRISSVTASKIVIEFFDDKSVRLVLIEDKQSHFFLRINFYQGLNVPHQIMQSYNDLPYGKHMVFYSSGNIASVGYANGQFEDTAWPKECGVIEFDEYGIKRAQTKEPKKCNYSTGVVRFFLPPGEYFVSTSSVFLREGPSRQARKIGKLVKGDKIQVLDFTDVRFQIDESFAPWAKVTSSHGEGWIYGAYVEPVNYATVYRKFFEKIDRNEFIRRIRVAQ